MLKDPFHWFPDQVFGTLLGYVFLMSILLDSLLPMLFHREGRAAAARVQDQWSYVLIHATVLLTLGAGLVLRLSRIGVTRTWVQYLGLLVLLGGAFIRLWSMVTLGQYFSRVVAIQKGHRLITSGPYRFVRHPAYTGMMMIYVGALLGIGTWAGALLTLLLLGAAVLYRIRVEEQALLQQFGEEYRRYGEGRGRLLPGF